MDKTHPDVIALRERLRSDRLRRRWAAVARAADLSYWTVQRFACATEKAAEDRPDPRSETLVKLAIGCDAVEAMLANRDSTNVPDAGVA